MKYVAFSCLVITRATTFFVRNRLIRNSSQIGLLTQETNLVSLIFLKSSTKFCVQSRTESSLSFTINTKHSCLYANYE